MTVPEDFSADVFAISAPPYRPPLYHLEDGEEHCALILTAFLNRSTASDGVAKQAVLRSFLDSRIDSEQDLHAWIGETLDQKPGGRTWDSCRRRADGWHSEGVRVLSMPGFSCPAVLFAKGGFNLDGFKSSWVSVFNSRKPRSVSPGEQWLKALRIGLAKCSSVVFASGTGTLTYDLVGCHALREKVPLVLAAPFSLFEQRSELNAIYGEEAVKIPVLSCLASTNDCPPARRLVCRDRLLANLSAVHLVIEIRSGGNLETVLTERQKRSPAAQIIFDPGAKTVSNAGNHRLIENHPAHAQTFRVNGPERRGPLAREHSALEKLTPPEPIAREDYLYHYTRACPGPWPGEPRMEYLSALLDGSPLCGHTALDTLIRILKEGRIRAGSKIIRGDEGVVSWSSRPPNELFLMRKWNAAIVRWTAEPFGIAARRDYLRKLGAKPAVYGGTATYEKLPEEEKYRFQVNKTRRFTWKDEREWRLRGDLALDCAKEGDIFVFVPTEEERQRLLELADPAVPVVLTEERSSVAGK